MYEFFLYSQFLTLHSNTVSVVLFLNRFVPIIKHRVFVRTALVMSHGGMTVVASVFAVISNHTTSH